jgi:hypothetical protein
MNVQPRWPAIVRNASYLNWEFLAPLSYGHTPTSGRNVRELVGNVGTISYFAIDLDKRFKKAPCYYYLCGIASLKCLVEMPREERNRVHSGREAWNRIKINWARRAWFPGRRANFGFDSSLTPAEVLAWAQWPKASRGKISGPGFYVIYLPPRKYREC